jgi:formate dehydrogenase subunit gamma
MFNTTQRFVHWLHAACFAVLAVSGLVLYAPFLQGLAIGYAGWTTRLMHRVGAVGLALVPLVYIIFSPKAFLDSMRRIFTWSKADLGWLRAAPAYYLLGREEAMPPQDKFNTGQKLFYLVVVICTFLFGISGFVMWFGKFAVPTWLFQLSVVVHDLCFIAYMAFFLVHFMLAVAHPLMKGALDGMLFGWMPEAYVRRHHAKYYEELKGKQGA